MRSAPWSARLCAAAGCDMSQPYLSLYGAHKRPRELTNHKTSFAPFRFEDLMILISRSEILTASAFEYWDNVPLGMP